MTTSWQARDAIQEIFYTVWRQKAKQVQVNGVPIGYEPEIRWPNVDENKAPPTDVAWGRVMIFETGGTQRSMGPRGGRVYRSIGSFIFEIFVPGGTGTELATKLAEIAKNAFDEVSSSEIFFKNVRIADVGPDGSAYQMNVHADYEYEAVK